MNKILQTINSVRKLFSNNVGQSFTTWFNTTLFPKSHYQLLHEFKNYVYVCITAIADSVGEYEPVVKRKDAESGRDKPVKSHPFLTVLKNPNPNMTQFELYEQTIIYKKLTGEAFWYVSLGEVTRTPKAIYMMRPDRVRIAVDDNGTITGYIYVDDNGTEVPLDADEVIYHRQFNPLNPYRGLGTVQAGLLSISADNVASRFQYNTLSSGGIPSGVLSIASKMNPELFEKFKAEFREQYTGPENANKTLIIQGTEAKYSKTGLSLGDFSLGDERKLTKEDIRQLFRVPEAILGKTDSTGLGRANIEAIIYIFANQTIEPEQNRFDDVLTTYLHKYYPKDKDLFIDHVSQVPEDKEAKLSENTQAVDKWKTRNEIRVDSGLDPVDGGDTLYFAFNQMPLETPVNQTKSLGKLTITKRLVVKDVTQDRFFEAIDKIENRAFNNYEKGLTNLLKSQQVKVVDVLSAVSGRKKKLKDIVEYNGAGFNLEFSPEELNLNLLEQLIAAIFASGQNAVELVGAPDVTFVVNQATRDAIFNSTQRLMQSFNEETALKLQQQLSQGIANNEDLKQLTKRIESVYKEAKGFRAERIARTESHRAVNEGVAQGYLQSGVKKMRWTTLANACEFCKAMDGKEVTIGQSFVPRGETVTGSDGGQYINDYADIAYADLHPNCNCKLVPIFN